jgi:WD40 repeat protein
MPRTPLDIVSARVCLLLVLAGSLATVGPESAARCAAPPVPPSWLPPTPLGQFPGCVPLSFSPDGRTLVTASLGSDGLDVWELATRQVRATLPDRGGWARAVTASTQAVTASAFTPDGRWLLAPDSEAAYHLWDLSTWRVVSKFTEEELRRAAATGPGGKVFAAPIQYRQFVTTTRLQVVEAVLFEPAAGRRLAELLKFGGEGPALAISPDGKALATGGDGVAVRLWDAAASRVRAALTARVHAATFSPCGRLLATAENGWDDTQVVLRDASTGKAVDVWHDQGGWCWMAFAHGGRLLVSARNTPFWFSGRSQGEVRFWDVARRRELVDLRISTEDVGGVVVSPDGTLLAVFDRAREPYTQVYRLPTPSGQVPLATAPPPPKAVEVSAAHPKELLVHLQDLSGDDAGKAYRAVWALVGRPKEAVAMLGAKLRPAPRPDLSRIRPLLADLASDSYEARTRATRELKKLGEQAEPALREALAGKPDLELRRRAETLLAALNGPLAPGDRLRGVRAVEALELIATSSARQLLEELAAGEPTARLTREAAASMRRLPARPSP